MQGTSGYKAVFQWLIGGSNEVVYNNDEKKWKYKENESAVNRQDTTRALSSVVAGEGAWVVKPGIREQDEKIY
jgi:hypothetical protein